MRKSVILSALQYLISNNVYFSNITINDHHLSLLPEDGNITIAQEVMLDCDDDTVTDSSDSFDNDILRTCVPRVCQTATEQENINRYLDKHTPPVVMWPGGFKILLMNSVHKGTFHVPFQHYSPDSYTNPMG